MPLNRVTFTGADDSVDPAKLAELSAEFPFIEWGILFGSGDGRPRFPSRSWVDRLIDVDFDHDLQLSAHLCGKYVRALVLDGDFTWERDYFAASPNFTRIQLNFHAIAHQACKQFPKLLEKHANHDYIFQVDGVNDQQVCMWTEENLGCPLFDTSGGAGVVPREWPEQWPGVYCGYAGGLGPLSIARELPRIIKSTDSEADYWIDMERQVRSEDDTQFDLQKVREVCEFVKPLIGQALINRKETI